MYGMRTAFSNSPPSRTPTSHTADTRILSTFKSYIIAVMEQGSKLFYRASNDYRYFLIFPRNNKSVFLFYLLDCSMYEGFPNLNFKLYFSFQLRQIHREAPVGPCAFVAAVALQLSGTSLLLRLPFPRIPFA